jgi:hypothetical protein
VSVSLIQRILDAKLADQPAAAVVVVLDLLAVVTALACFFALTRSRRELVAGPSAGLLCGLAACNTYFACREVSQAFHMHRRGLGVLYWGDWWNSVDVACVVGIFAVLAMAAPLGGSEGGQPLRLTDGFRALAACCSVVIWLKLLGTIKVSRAEL